NQDVRVFENHAGNGDALLLAARKLQATLAYARGVAIGKLRDEIGELCAPCRLLDLSFARLGASIGDVEIDAVVKENGILRHDADSGAHALLGRIFQIASVDA